MSRDRVSKRHRAIYKMAHDLSPILLNKYSFETDYLEPTDENYIVISNHLAELDTVMLARAFSQHMYFVAGEHFTRTFLGKLMKWGGDPIFEFKGSSALKTAREIVKRVKSGCNVHIFAEGCRSFNGETLTLPESAGKLVKSAGAGLVTYKFEGSYFVAPRWAKFNRVGPIRGKIVRHYSAEEVRAMSARELTDCINRDIYENAYERQRKEMNLYKGKNLAVGLENYLIKCPECGATDAMETSGDNFRCSCCGQEGRYNEYGFLEGDGLKFDSVYDWGKWGEGEIKKAATEAPADEILYSNEDVRMYELTADHEKVLRAEGRIDAYKDRLEFHKKDGQTEVYDYKGIPPMEMMFGRTMLFSYEGHHYEVEGEGFKALKYTLVHTAFKEQQEQA